MESSEEVGGECFRKRRPEGVDAFMASEVAGGGFGPCLGASLGMADEHDGYKVVCGIFPGQSSSISGLLRDSADSDGADFVRIEEMGLLDCLAAGQCGEPDIISEGGPGVHADSELPVPGQRHLVALHMV